MRDKLETDYITNYLPSDLHIGFLGTPPFKATGVKKRSYKTESYTLASY